MLCNLLPAHSKFEFRLLECFGTFSKYFSFHGVAKFADTELEDMEAVKVHYSLTKEMKY